MNDESRVRNMTPHAIVLRTPERDYVFPPDPAGPARVATNTEPCVAPWGSTWPVVVTNLGEVENLPDADGKTIYLVSRIVLDALKGSPFWRRDVLCPDTGPDSAIRDADGKIAAVKRFTY